ncbi:MAG: tRNA (guanosine(37)-N1)-methyltransferase TrmD [Syntrophaceae bacterium]|nr:tRNA (guanosine(37)-N1)-methyltransferase TrmD [Syntrophaceae bacterium]
MIRFDILTLFPELFNAAFDASLLRKAIDKSLIEINLHNIRDYATGRHRVTDDIPFGGGGGMVMKVEPIAMALDDVISDRDNAEVILLSPQGEIFRQEIAEDLSMKKRIVLICGHYEGVDERVKDHLVDRELSIGDYVLTGGEYPAMVIIDAVSRLVPGFVGNSDSVLYDSFTTGLLEGPHYTRPREYRGWKVPEVLLSGHKKKIEEWRHASSLLRTLKRRPDLLEKAELTEEDKEIIEALRNKVRGISDS